YKILALNRAIAGWCRYYQYTSRAATQFDHVEWETFWLMAHWLARKYQWSIPQTLQEFRRGGPSLGVGDLRLLRHTSFPALRYAKRFFKPNPYTTQEAVTREELPESHPWTGYEVRPGMADLRLLAIERDGHKCCLCGAPVTAATCEVDHLRPAAG